MPPLECLPTKISWLPLVFAELASKAVGTLSTLAKPALCYPVILAQDAGLPHCNRRVRRLRSWPSLVLAELAAANFPRGGGL